MPANHLGTASMPLDLGGDYTLSTLRDAIEDWSVDAKFHYKVVMSQKARVDYRCMDSTAGCNWRIYAVLNRGSENIYVLQEKLW